MKKSKGPNKFRKSEFSCIEQFNIPQSINKPWAICDHIFFDGWFGCQIKAFRL